MTYKEAIVKALKCLNGHAYLNEILDMVEKIYESKK